MLVHWIVLHNRIEKSLNPERRQRGQANNFYRYWDHKSEPELELLVRTWHKAHAAQVSKQKNLQSQSHLIMSTDSELRNFFLIKCLQQVFITAREAPFSSKEMVNIDDKHGNS